MEKVDTLLRDKPLQKSSPASEAHMICMAQETITHKCKRMMFDQQHDCKCHLQMQQVKQLFPRDGSKATPPHPSADFKWKDYCPMAFRQLREVFNIDPGDYMLSICGMHDCHHHLCCCQVFAICCLLAPLLRVQQDNASYH